MFLLRFVAGKSKEQPSPLEGTTAERRRLQLQSDRISTSFSPAVLSYNADSRDSRVFADPEQEPDPVVVNTPEEEDGFSIYSASLSPEQPGDRRAPRSGRRDILRPPRRQSSNWFSDSIRWSNSSFEGS